MSSNIQGLYDYIASHTERAVRDNRYNWKTKEAPGQSGVNRLLFLGTGGNPYNLASQFNQTGGICMFLDEALLLVDPGPASVFHAVRNGVDVRGIDAIYISHGHTDHYLDAGTAIEAMTHIMSKRRGTVILPEDMIQNGLISQYHLGRAPIQEGYVGGPAEVVVARPGVPIPFANGQILPVAAYHGGNNHGFTYQSPTIRIGYTSDTSYITSYERNDGTEVAVTWEPIQDFHRVKEYRKDLKETYAGVDVLVANVSYFHLFGHRHITGIGLAHLLQDSGIKACIITHLDPACYYPVDLTEKIATYVQEVSGVKTILAKDNLEFRISDLIK